MSVLNRLILFSAAGVTALWSTPATAMPPGPTTFCSVYPDAALCASEPPPCTTCHDSGGPPALNAYGAAVSGELLSGMPRPLTEAQYSAGLPDALAAVESIDSDMDGFSNLEEIELGTFPGDESSAPQAAVCPPEGLNPQYDVCNYDFDYTYRKLHIDFCGQSPSYEAYSAFAALDNADKPDALDDALTACLQTEWWRGKDGAVCVVTIGARVAEVDRKTVADISGDVTTVLTDDACAEMPIAEDQVPKLLGIEPLGERSRADEVAEHGGDLPALSTLILVWTATGPAGQCVPRNRPQGGATLSAEL